MTRPALEAANRAEAIARLNDLARKAMGVACTAVATQGFRALLQTEQTRVRELIETFDAFTPDNDPHGERDFGAIYQTNDGSWKALQPRESRQKIFWKIDYYDQNLRYWCNPLDAECRRVMTVMLAGEY